MSRIGVEPHLFVIFGATGDLMHRKLLPALYELVTGGRIVGRSVLLGVARTPMTDEEFREQAGETLAETKPEKGEESKKWCGKYLHYFAMPEGDEEEYKGLVAKIEEIEQEHDLTGNRVYYLALPPSAFPSTIESLGRSGLNESPGWTRIVVEKPFGRDLASAVKLNKLLHEYFDESQVYRIDHYLGKETVQNLIVFRFANLMFESIWNRDRVRSVQITVSEDIGIEHRAGYYETAGALRDMVQNHLTQLLALTAMEPPVAFRADDIREEKVQLLRSIAPIDPHEVVLGQYEGGEANGENVPGYREEKKVAPDSTTETYAAIRLEIANWRWQGVPFYIRTGKRLARRQSQIVVNFRKPPVSLFRPFQADNAPLSPNTLVITIQPDEGFDLFFEVKTPGESRVTTQNLKFRYSEAFGRLADGYQTLLLDIILGDQTLFVRADEVEASWTLYMPLLENRPEPIPYPAGSWGPKEAEGLIIATDDRWWVQTS